MTQKPSPIKLVTPRVSVHLPAHEHAARRRRERTAALPGIPGSRPPSTPKPPVQKGRKTIETRNPALPPLGWGLSRTQG